jgi:L-aspartate oxidase
MARLSENRVINTDVLVLGAGIAGCFAAIKAKETGLNVLMIDKGNIGRSGVSHQMSGVLTYFDPRKDNYDDWYRECVEAGQGVADQDCLADMITETTDRIHELSQWGAAFLRYNGEFVRKPI